MTWCTTNPSQGTLPRADISGCARRGRLAWSRATIPLHVLGRVSQCPFIQECPFIPTSPGPKATCAYPSMKDGVAMPPCHPQSFPLRPWCHSRPAGLPGGMCPQTSASAPWHGHIGQLHGGPRAPNTPPVRGAAPSAEVLHPALSWRGFFGMPARSRVPGGDSGAARERSEARER